MFLDEGLFIHCTDNKKCHFNLNSIIILMISFSLCLLLLVDFCSRNLVGHILDFGLVSVSFSFHIFVFSVC